YRLNSYSAIYHEAGEALAVDQDHAGVHRPRVVNGLAREAAGSDEYALTGLLTMKRTNEALYLRPPDDIIGRIPLGLNVHAGQTQRVLVDHAVDATVTAAADSTSPLLYTAIAHCYQNI